MKFRQTVFYVTCLIIFAGGSAHAAILLAVDDTIGIPASRLLTVEAPGVLKNDTLGEFDAEEAGLTVIWLTGGSKGELICPDDAEPGLCADGSFQYTPGPSFDGEDTFQYQAMAPTGETATATVTLSACSGGPTIFSCWHEAPYLAKLADLSYNVYRESFEGTAWDVVRSPDLGEAVTALEITSKDIAWTTNHPLTNGITTGSGPARTGLWGVFDPEHGLAAPGTLPSDCDIDNPPVECRPYDGFSGSGTALHGVGGYLSGFNGANIAIILDGVNQGGGRLTGTSKHFFGVIDAAAAGFTGFEFRELDGKVGQELLIFGDDFIIATANEVPANNPPALDPVGNQSVDENYRLRITLTASDRDDGDWWSFSMSGGPTGADFYDNGDGTTTFEWRPDYTQAGSYEVNFTVTDNGLPEKSTSELITITVNDMNRPPELNHIGDRSVTESTLLSILLTASDQDGNNLSFEVETLPPGSLPFRSTFTDNTNGTATFSWTPALSQLGVYPLRFTVRDDWVPEATVWEDVTITVIPAAGDINGNGTVSLEDMIIALQVLTGQTPAVVFPEADVDGDGRIGLAEAIMILHTLSVP